MVSMAAGHVAEVTVRRYADSPECDVVVVVREQKLVLKPIAPASPWQNSFAERLIGSIRRECLDYIIVLGE